MLRLPFRWGLLALASLLMACVWTQSEGRKLYRTYMDEGGYRERAAVLETYSLEQQYEIFLYGMQRVHPPDTEPADTIAKRGKQALEYVLRMVAASDKVMDYVGSMEIFRAMVVGGHYLVCDDVEAMKQIEANGSRIADEDWRRYYLLALRSMQNACSRRRGK